MRRIPVDTARVAFVGTGKTAARAKYAELADGSRRRVPDAQDTNDEGVPMWTVDVLVDDDEADRAEVVSVKVASYDEPRTEKWQPVAFRNLVAFGYVAQGSNRVAYSFTADAIEGPVSGRKGAQNHGEQNAA
ncbi:MULTISPECIES: hypothetical protein [Pseudonocardia]|uniref:Plasmid replication, integration and excision activator n=2 Tax=Pseudonocardia TaxID=1847 RepID=A0A1Y2N1B1_PSEAH|nr:MULTISPECIES: hypothetical protein [Pseudonocardia]OSY41031.1 hypothetical protein BG845_02373 [Pseudonocardia autotrophica]TDN73841.1 hypothetical protein C8E95_2948 [Pseudonocardia autotrophica]BBG04589.1 hypothetical protein Pdca_57980 [Pseudonocardia autotrophica]GEC25709.1 hypothetical protein PSA01_27380 [Pseudonocardia saturnea]